MPSLFSIFCFLLLTAWIVDYFGKENIGNFFSAIFKVILVIGVLSLIYKIIYRKQIAETKKQEIISKKKKLENELADHLTALSIRKQQLVTKDAYGNIVDKDWTKELNYFIDSTLSRKPWVLKEYSRQDIIDTIEDKMTLILSVKRKKNVKTYKKDGIKKYNRLLVGQEYEELCHYLLKESGWEVRNTKASGDQGVDLIAEKKWL